MNELALFSGTGGGILGGHLLGWRTICAVEWDAYAAGVLIARQNDGVLPPFPIWDDVCTFDGRPWKGRVDVVSGGFPCQDISSAGKGAGIEGKRSGMWFQMARVIREVGPRYVFVENSPLLTRRGLNRVLGDLAAMGYDARWGVLGAVDAGAPHKRDRIWIVAHAQSLGEREQANQADPISNSRETRSESVRGREYAPDVAHADSVRELQPEGNKCDIGGRIGDGGQDVAHSPSDRGRSGNPGRQYAEDARQRSSDPGNDSRRVGPWDAEPNVGRVVNGLAARVDRLKALGNGQVPAVAALAWRILTQ